MLAPMGKGKIQLLVRSLAIAGGLLAFKLVIFWMTNSMALLASAADSFMDLLISFASYLFVRSASRPADHNHPYGHGKIESLAGLLQSVVIAAMSVGIAALSVHRIMNPEPIFQPILGIVVIAMALALNLWHVRNLRIQMLASDSPVMASEYVHYASDILAYLGVLASLAMFRLFGQAFWDPLVSLIIVVYLLKNAASIFYGAMAELLDEQLPNPVLGEIIAFISGFHPKITGFHDLRTRKVGTTKFIDFHINLKDVAAFDEAHMITESLIAALQKRYPGAIIHVHSHPEDAPSRIHQS
jgi:ferrous-iron efflux pump FieF